MVVYDLQKEFNDNDYKMNQRIVQIKKQQDEEKRL